MERGQRPRPPTHKVGLSNCGGAHLMFRPHSRYNESALRKHGGGELILNGEVEEGFTVR